MIQFRTAIATVSVFRLQTNAPSPCSAAKSSSPSMKNHHRIETLLFFVGAMTLGIGGVGVMNIMLVSVEERVRESVCAALSALARNIFAGNSCWKRW